MQIRPARTNDIIGIRQLIDSYAPQGRLLSKETVTLYESVQEFTVAVEGEQVVGCGALHVLWEDLAEVRTVAVAENLRGKGVGHQILDSIIDRAQSLGVKRIFCLTFETKFFGSHGFEVIEGTPVEPEIYQELLRSY
ncbi:MAG: amino-acid N-acetyltransferase, partial [Candidatus Planktophila sp.]|nr:amino-acid N-acetyltransferase [Candidatus Planktophila sp.]